MGFNLFKKHQNKRKHWVIVLSWLHYAGAEKQALLFAEELISRYGDRVTVIGLEAPGSVNEVCKKMEIPLIYFPFSHRVGWIQKLFRMSQFIRTLRRLEPDFIAPYCMPANVLCGVTWRFTGANRCVWQQRDIGLHRRDGIMEKLALILTPRYISNSTHGAKWLTNELRVKEEKMEVIYNGVKPVQTERSSEWKKSQGIDKNVKIVTMLASLHGKKDHLTLLKAWKIVCDETENGSLLLVLAGKEMDTYNDIQTFVREEGMSKQVLITGYISDINVLLSATDLAVFSSGAEGVPNGVLEPMQHSLPVISTDYPGMREALGPEGEDQIVPPVDAQALAEKILYFLNHSEEHKKIGNENKKRISTIFSMEQMVKKTRSQFLSHS